MFFKKIYFLIILIVNSFSYAQDRLEPYEQTIFDDVNERFKYFSEVRKKLFDNVHEEYKPLARFIVIPSFKAEYALTFDIDYKKRFLTYTTVKNYSIWDTMGELNKEAETFKIIKEIDSIDSNLTVTIINNFIKKVKYQNYYGYDGTRYYFSNSEKTATIWSPKSNSRTYQLIKIMNEIIELVKSDEKIIKFSPKLIQKIKNLNPK